MASTLSATHPPFCNRASAARWIATRAASLRGRPRGRLVFALAGMVACYQLRTDPARIEITNNRRQQMAELTDNTRVWMITGASRGLGAALAQSVLEHGERVVLTARDPGAVAEL